MTTMACCVDEGRILVVYLAANYVDAIKSAFDFIDKVISI